MFYCQAPVFLELGDLHTPIRVVCPKFRQLALRSEFLNYALKTEIAAVGLLRKIKSSFESLNNLKTTNSFKMFEKLFFP